MMAFTGLFMRNLVLFVYPENKLMAILDAKARLGNLLTLDICIKLSLSLILVKIIG